MLPTASKHVGLLQAMRILLLNQPYPPDVAASGQYAAELVAALTAAGNDVTVIASSRDYNHPSQRFPRRSTQHGATILRVATTGLGKSPAWRRAVDFASFFLSCSLLLTFLSCTQPRYDVVIALTSPPLIGFLAALFTRLRGGRLIAWIMDLNPDEAIAAGWLRPTSLTARFLEATLRFSLNTAAHIVVLDTFMRDRISARGIPAAKLTVIPPWTLSADATPISYSPIGRERFRLLHNLSSQFVVMYAGNLSPCHPLDSLLDAARALAANPTITFCFIGGGSGMTNVRAAGQRLPNILCLPYQSLNELPASLSAADLQVVVMGDAFVGIVHPCKIYNILALGQPYLYIGPQMSHITSLTPSEILGKRAWQASHGDVVKIVSHITKAAETKPGPSGQTSALAEDFKSEILISRFLSLICIQPRSSEANKPSVAAQPEAAEN
jgi:colanic acid biosynthesis glycosyl transferase WcaI